MFKLICRCVVLLTTVLVGLRAGDALSVSSSPLPISVDIRGRPIPTFQNGFVISFEPHTGDVWRFEQGGNRVGNVRLAIPDAFVERVTSAAAAPDGRVAILASAATSDGKLAPVIAWMDSAGNLAKIVRTTPFVAHRIAFAQDGTLWAVGHLFNEQGTADVPKHDVVWRFDADGRKMHSLLPSDSFSRRWPSNTSWLTTNAGRVAVYFESTKEWAEIDNSSGKLVGRWSVSLPPAAQVGGIALTSSGLAIIAADVPDEQNANKLGIYRLDRQSGRVTPIDFSELGGAYYSLLGADGDNAVLMEHTIDGPFKIVLARVK